jgi:hypothetical protein
MVMQLVCPIAQASNVQRELIFQFGCARYCERMPLILGNLWYINENVVTAFELEVGWFGDN